MELNFNQRIMLNSVAEESGSNYSKYYVFRMTKSSVIPKKCKMVLKYSFFLYLIFIIFFVLLFFLVVYVFCFFTM
jgi:hypothetical protein